MKIKKYLQPWVAILLIAVAIRIAYLFLTPPTQTPDETFIFKRIWHTLLSLTNPNLTNNLPISYPNNEFYYPPLYFYLTALLIKFFSLFQPFPASFNQFHLSFYLPLKILSLTLSTFSLILIWKIINQVKLHQYLKLTSFIIISLLPTFASFSTYPNYNILLFFFITLFIYLLTSANQPSILQAALLGVIFGLSLLTKFDALVLLPTFLTYLYLSKKRPGLRYLLIFFLSTSFVSGWWYLNNLLTHGWLYSQELFRASVSAHIPPLSFQSYLESLTIFTLISFIASFGAYNNIQLPYLTYIFTIILTVISIIRLFSNLFKIVFNKSLLLQRLYISLFVSFLTNLLLFLYLNLQFDYQPQGRYFFPSLIFLSLTLTLGLSTFFPKKRLFLLPLSSFMFLLSLNLTGLNCISYTFYDVNYLPFRTCAF